MTLLLLVAGGIAALRYGVLLPQGRHLIETRVDGLKIGRFGRLHVEGLAGDIWQDFTLKRLTIADEKGVWLDARNIHMTWRYGELVRRRLHADRIVAEQVRLLRRPVLTPKGEDRGLPVSFHLDDVRARLELLPAFSGARGVYDVKSRLNIARRGHQSGRVTAASLLHPGDRLEVRFDIGKDRPIRVYALADEAKGGAIAGTLGLPADQRFVLRLYATGKMSDGRFTANAISGATRPLVASGRWRPGGGSASGRIQLSASSLTADLARRLGPEVSFAAGGRKGPSLYAIDARLTSANLAARVRGFVDPGERRAGPDGIAVTLTTADLSKVAGGPAKGPAKVAGVWRGDTVAWTFDGRAEAADAAFGGYALSRVAGPVVLARKKGAASLTADLTGAGGSGQGWVAALLGAAPRARLEGDQLADGRLMLRRLDVTGSGLRVAATGGRNLLGGLNFRGEATLSNLAAARPGAGGSMTADWSAAQPAAGKAWSLNLDAAASGFASGYAELDRLLGAKPTLKAAASVSDGAVAVSKAELAGARAAVSTAGMIGPAGKLALKLDWTAEGPFRAGPVEITGKAKGSGESPANSPLRALT